MQRWTMRLPPFRRPHQPQAPSPHQPQLRNLQTVNIHFHALNMHFHVCAGRVI